MDEIDWQENEVAKINAMNKFRVKKPPHAISAAQAVTWLIDIVENFDNDLINVDNFFF